MYIIEKADEFDKWLRKLKDLRAKAINNIVSYSKD
jgi:putative component of toxin-antitoxin plasmid stabilization module